MSRSHAAVATGGRPAGADYRPHIEKLGPPLDLADRLNRLVSSNSAPEAAYRTAPDGHRLAGSGVRPDALRGHPKFCPVCESGFGHFLPFGLDRRKNALCPGCGSLERHRFLWTYLTRMPDLLRGRRTVLHIAPEGAIRRRLGALPGIRYLAADLYRPDVPHRMDVIDLPLRDRSVDLVICSHVLEHVGDDRTALREFARVLRPRGATIIMVPLDLSRDTVEDDTATTAARRHAAFGHPYHVRICGRDYGDRIAAAGFSVHRVDSATLSPHRRRYHRINKTSLFDCRLP